jgi:alpha-tubulin suppressor-like RCC1 family protein
MTLNGKVGVPFSQNIPSLLDWEANWPGIQTSVISGAFPSGLILSGNTVAGTPTQVQNSQVTFNLQGQVSLITGAKDISATGDNCFVLLNNGSILAWGANGSVGNDLLQLDIPSSFINLQSISCYGTNFLGLKNDGTVVSRLSQSWMQVPSGLSSVTKISAGRNHSLALKSDGTVVGWGREGDLSTFYPPPTGLNGVADIAAGSRHGLALKSDGTVVGWIARMQAGEDSESIFLQWRSELDSLNSDLQNYYSRVLEIAAGDDVNYFFGEVLPVEPPSFPRNPVISPYSLGADVSDALHIWGGEGGLIAEAPGNPSSRIKLKKRSDLYLNDQYIIGGEIKKSAIGTNHILVLRNDGTVVAFGRDNAGQITGRSSTASFSFSISAGFNLNVGSVFVGSTPATAVYYGSQRLL